MKAPVMIGKVNLNQLPEYQKEGLPFYSASGDEESCGFYYSDYCQVFGFCYSCGLFCGGTEPFGFNNGLSANWQEGLETEFRVNEGNFDGRILDEIFDHEETLKYYRGQVPEEASHYDPFPEKRGVRC